MLQLRGQDLCDPTNQKPSNNNATVPHAGAELIATFMEVRRYSIRVCDTTAISP